MSIRVIDHELAHAWQRHSDAWPWGREPDYDTLRFAEKFGTFGLRSKGTPSPAELWSWEFINWKVTWKQDRYAWTDYTRKGRLMEDFVETAVHMITGTSYVKVNSGRYNFMLGLLPGLGNSSP